MPDRAAARRRAEKGGIETFDDERPVDQGERDHGERRDGGDEDQRLVRHRKNGAEENVKEIDIRALRRDDQHAEREADEIEAREARILAQCCHAGDEPCKEGDGETGDETADAHGPERQTGNEKADGRAREERVAHRVAHEAHAAKYEKGADGAAADREREAGDERAAHEAIFDEGGDQRVIDHAASPHASET